MTSMASKFRTRRAAVRRARAIERALSHATSPNMRDEILAIAHRSI
ncbi:MAG: hypothetical protein JWO79_946 [Actinomycetia bacterium]|jgi:hypothetical protein|nr:hypothetical protein [Actinomycetes bacterium]MDQ1656387.1 hypothetical protein [Cryptosporangiaceae bacterium]